MQQRWMKADDGAVEDARLLSFIPTVDGSTTLTTDALHCASCCGAVNVQGSSERNPIQITTNIMSLCRFFPSRSEACSCHDVHPHTP